MKEKVYLAVFSLIIWGLFNVPGTARADGDTDKPPAGIVATSMTLQQLLDAHDKAVGAKTWSTDIEEGQISEFGFRGRYRDVYSHDDYKSSVDIGPLHTERGRVDGQRWRANSNGVVVMLHNVHRRDEVNAALIAGKHTGDRKDLVLLGEVEKPIPAYVVELKPASGRHEWLFYDKVTYLIDRDEAVYPEGRVTTTLSDYRRAGGQLEPWHVHASDGDVQNDQDVVTTSDRFDIPVSAADLQMPATNVQLVQFPAGVHTVTLPVRIVDGDIIVRLNVGARGLDFILDSGASGIVFDQGITENLGLQTAGPLVKTEAGTWLHSKAIVPQLNIGPISMHNVVVDSLPFHFHEDVETKIVGLLGFDFIANATIAIDYAHEQLIATAPGYFVPPPDAFALDAQWDDGVPFIPVQIGEATGEHFILDTGSNRGLVFSSFAKEHPADIKDQGLGHMLRLYEPFIYFAGVGGLIETVPTQVKQLRLGGVSFSEWMLFQSTGNHMFEGEDTDGLIGYDFLKFFTVYLDYHDAHVYLAPNALFKRFATR